MDKKPTLKQKLNAQEATVNHILQVQKLINKLVMALLERGNQHDNSKLYDPEADTFAFYTSKLHSLEFGSEEYKQCLEEMKTTLDHHYAKNRHHPEHFANGITDMNLIDLIEMLADWKAASMRHDSGNLEKSIDYNQKRFQMPAELVKIFKNTIVLLEE